MNYFEDKRIMESIERNKTMAFVEGRKWCIAEHFWDDSIIEKVTDSKGNLIYYNGMGHSDIGVTMNVYTHLGIEDAAAEMARTEEVESARREQEKLNGVKEGKEKQSRKMFRVV